MGNLVSTRHSTHSHSITTMPAVSPVFEIYGAAQSYEWGTLGKDGSKVAQFAKPIPGFEYNESKPYAELWMGTHPSLPSKLAKDGSSLKELLDAHPELLGSKVEKHYGKRDLPFLFKVLAIGKALSIQAHPDKELARKLFKERPDVYKDDNHKPEMAVALTDFSGFCGFRPLPQIVEYLKNVPEFEAVVGSEAASAFISATTSDSASASKLQKSPPAEKPSAEYAGLQKALRALFTALMKADPESSVKPNLRKLVNRYKGKSSSSKEMKYGTIEELVVRLDEQFPDDVGAFCSFLLNVVELKKGEAVFLKANEPHAYLSGDIMECMATSDNVVRAGLTPKLRDVPTLTSMLTYTYGPSDSQLMAPKPFRSPSKCTTEYNPPIEEFSVLLIDTREGGAEEHPALEGPSILIATELHGDSAAAKLTFEGPSGEQKEELEIKREGQTFFIAAGTKVSFEGKFIAYRAFVEVDDE